MKPGILCLLLVVWVTQVSAQILSFSPIRMEGGYVVVNMSLSSMVTSAFERKMRSGLTQRILYRIVLREDPDDRVVAIALRVCSVTFDLWEENWTVECSVLGNTTSRVVTRYSQLLMHIASLQNFRFPQTFRPVATRRYRVEVQVQVNPISRQLLDKVKMWLRQSERGSQFSGYMGSVLSLFVDKSIGGADMQIKIHSKKVWGREIP